MDKGLKLKVLYEISQIDKLIADSKPLLDLCSLKEPNFIELSASAMVLHSFYNGIENILVMEKNGRVNKENGKFLESS